MNTFSELGLSQDILKALPELGIETPSEIQQKAIPLLVNQKLDFIGLAQTGTGKTAAFGLPLLESMDLDLDHTQALVLAPTRELGQQIAGQLEAFAKYKRGLDTLAVYGGAPIMGQIKALKRTRQVIIATPGRLMDLMKRKAIDLSKITHLVLDEADEMLNMGFKEDIDEILKFTPKEKSTWLFSATMSRDIRRIVENYMTDPQEVQVGRKDEVNKNIKHEYVFLKVSDKQEALRRFIDLEPEMRGIIFCRTKMDTQELSADLRKLGYAIDAIHGDLTQNARDKVMGLFKTHAINLLAATDVAARGIDVKDITHVIHYSLPDDSEYYTHRSGRTARAGQRGISLSLVSRRDLSKIKSLERGLKIEFEKIQVPLQSDIKSIRIAQWAANLSAADIADNIPADLLERVEGELASLTREELILKLLSMEMAKLGHQAGDRDLNESSKGRQDRDRDNSRSKRTERRSSERGGDDRRKDRGDRKERKRSDRPDKRERSGSTYEQPQGDMVRFMMNIGRKEHVNKSNLLRFICDESGLTKSQIGDIQVQDRRSYFEVNSAAAGNLPSKFKDIDINGRLLKVVKG